MYTKQQKSFFPTEFKHVIRLQILSFAKCKRKDRKTNGSEYERVLVSVHLARTNLTIFVEKNMLVAYSILLNKLLITSSTGLITHLNTWIATVHLLRSERNKLPQ